MKRTISFFAAAYLSFGTNGSIIFQVGIDNETDAIVASTINYVGVSNWHVFEGTFDALDMIVLNTAVAENLINVPEAILISLLGLAMISFGFFRRNKRALNQNGSYRRRFGAYF